MRDLVIIGGGFAGVAAASSAAALRDASSAHDRLGITVLNPDPWMTLRPRLYEADPADARVHLPDLLGPLGVDLVVGTVTHVDLDRRLVDLSTGSTTETRTFDGLVLAAGSRLRRPATGDVHDVDTYDDALALRDHLRAVAARTDRPVGRRFGAVVVGAGLAGIETATELAGTLAHLARTNGHAGTERVVLIDPAARISDLLGQRPARPLADALTLTGVELVLGHRVTAADTDGVTLDDGTRISAGTVVWTAGLEASPLTAQLTDELDPTGRIQVDEMLRVAGSEAVFAAGDVSRAPADDGHASVMSCQHAIPTGMVAGHNAAAKLLGAELQPFRADPYVTCIDLGAAGALFTTGWERTPRATGPAGKAMKRQIIADIHPARWIAREPHDPDSIEHDTGRAALWA